MMLFEPFSENGSRLIKFKDTVYKVKVETEKTHKPCSEKAFSSEIESVFRALIHQRHKLQPTKIETEHLLVDCQLNPWGVLKKLEFYVNGKPLSAFPDALNLKVKYKKIKNRQEESVSVRDASRNNSNTVSINKSNRSSRRTPRGRVVSPTKNSIEQVDVRLEISPRKTRSRIQSESRKRASPQNHLKSPMIRKQQSPKSKQPRQESPRNARKSTAKNTDVSGYKEPSPLNLRNRTRSKNVTPRFTRSKIETRKASRSVSRDSRKSGSPLVKRKRQQSAPSPTISPKRPKRQSNRSPNRSKELSGKTKITVDKVSPRSLGVHVEKTWPKSYSRNEKTYTKRSLSSSQNITDADPDITDSGQHRIINIRNISSGTNSRNSKDSSHRNNTRRSRLSNVNHDSSDNRKPLPFTSDQHPSRLTRDPIGSKRDQIYSMKRPSRSSAATMEDTHTGTVVLNEHRDRSLIEEEERKEEFKLQSLAAVPVSTPVEEDRGVLAYGARIVNIILTPVKIALSPVRNLLGNRS